MGKKRQQDFSKTQLRPGRSLTRGRNVTIPSCKSKKIVTSRKKVQKSELTVLDCLKYMKSGFSTARLSAVNQLQTLFDKQREVFFIHIMKILESVFKLLLDCDDDIRFGVVKLIKNIFGCPNSEALKMKFTTFIPFLTNTISCGMTNSALKIKCSTLKLLRIILDRHPNLICNSVVILKNFPHMIIGSPCNPRTSRSSLPIICDGRIDSENYRMTVVECMSLFLKEMLKNFQTNNVEEFKIEHEMHWDCDVSLYLEIYAGGGLKPVNIEKSLANSFSSQELTIDDSSVNEDFLIPILDVIPQIFIEEIASQTKGDDRHLPVKTIKNLNMLLKVLCDITDWVRLMPCEEVDRKIVRFLFDEIDGRSLFPFYPSGVFSCKNQCTEVAELNLAVCYLYNKYLIQVENIPDRLYVSITSYVDSVFQYMSYEIKCKSIPMVLKIMKMYYGLINIDSVGKFTVGTLFHMSSLLKNDHRSENVINHFIKLSLDPAYEVLTESQGMDNWYCWLLTQLTEIPRSDKVNKNLLHVIKMIANRKYVRFCQCLATVDDREFKALLKYDNPDVKETVIFLIYSLKDIKGSLLEHISNVLLLDTSFPAHYAIRLIRLLTCRFTENLQSTTDTFKKGRIDFIQFLLNIAVDSLNMSNEKWFDFAANKYTKAMEPLQDTTTHTVFPSLQWKEHSNLFKVCQKSLSQLPQKLVSRITMLMFKEILGHTKNLPMHSTIAILKLSKNELKDKQYQIQIEDLTFSSLLTASILTRMSPEEEWYKYNVVEPIDSMALDRSMALDSLHRHLENVKEMDSVAVYYILRICKFYLDKQLFKPEDGERVLNILETFKVRWILKMGNYMKTKQV